MKRHPTLRPLSREHHLFLMWCRNVRWWVEGHPRAPDAEAVLAEWRGNLPYIEAHFRIEETRLLPLVSQWLYEDAAPYIETIQQAHEAWRDGVQTISTPPTTAELLALATLLHDHIRYEERVFFPWLQSRLTEAQWEQLKLK